MVALDASLRNHPVPRLVLWSLAAGQPALDSQGPQPRPPQGKRKPRRVAQSDEAVLRSQPTCSTSASCV